MMAIGKPITVSDRRIIPSPNFLLFLVVKGFSCDFKVPVAAQILHEPPVGCGIECWVSIILLAAECLLTVCYSVDTEPHIHCYLSATYCKPVDY